jgi:hypothetical protein
MSLSQLAKLSSQHPEARGDRDGCMVSINISSERTGLSLEPDSAIFIDDKVDMVLIAHSLGMHGIVFDNIK